MKNNLLAFKSCNVDSCLPTPSDFMEFVIANKFEDREFVEMLHLITDDYEDDEYWDPAEEENDRLRREMSTEPEPDMHSNSLYAGYADCMDEAIRFLVEEENISAEHPVIKNLKAHLEKSKQRILETCLEVTEVEVDAGKIPCSADNFEINYPLHSAFLETFQNCRGSS